MSIVPRSLLLEAAINSKLAYTREKHFYDKLTTASGFINYQENLQIISFAGSNDPNDWILNFTALPVKYKGFWCHAGFAYSHHSIWKDMEKYIDYNRPTLVTGHSLGGTSAELTMLCLDKIKNKTLITFGKPNVFYKASRPVIKADHVLSVVSGSDIVARVPRYLYRPNKNQDMLYFTNTGKSVVNPTYKFRRDDWKTLEMASDHSVELYYDKSIEYGRLS